jgi:hypothetical protein
MRQTQLEAIRVRNLYAILVGHRPDGARYNIRHPKLCSSPRLVLK